MKWAIELSEYDIQYKPRLSLKGQVLTNFIAKLPQKQVQTDTTNHCTSRSCYRLLVTNSIMLLVYVQPMPCIASERVHDVAHVDVRWMQPIATTSTPVKSWKTENKHISFMFRLPGLL